MLIGLFALNNLNGMGNNGSMPWPSNKEDLKLFKQRTTNNVVVMGRGTWESTDMPSPLPNRVNVVFTSSNIELSGAIRVCCNVIEGLRCIEQMFPDKEIYVIGGANLLEQAMPILDKLIITRINDNHECDTVIAIEKWLPNFELLSVVDYETFSTEEWICKTT